MHQHEGFSQKKISQKMFTLFSSVQLRRLNGFEQRCHKAALQKSASYYSDRHNQNSSLARIRTKNDIKKENDHKLHYERKKKCFFLNNTTTLLL